MCCRYSKNRLDEKVLLSTQKNCLTSGIRNYSHFYAQNFCFLSTGPEFHFEISVVRAQRSWFVILFHQTNIIFLISLQKLLCWYIERDGSFKYPQYNFERP